MPESLQSCFELSIHLSVFFSRKLFLVPVHAWFATQTNVWKYQKATRCFLAQATLPCVPKKSLLKICPPKKVSRQFLTQKVLIYNLKIGVFPHSRH